MTPRARRVPRASPHAPFSPRLAALALGLLAAAAPLLAEERVFTATAEIEGGRAGAPSRLAVTLLIDRETPLSDALRLGALVLDGGQDLLRAALRGRSDGRLRLGAVEYPLNLVTSRSTTEGRRYVVVTERLARADRIEGEDEEEAGHPFGVLDFEVDERGRGEGIIHPAAAIGFDADGYVVIEDAGPRRGRLLDIGPAR